MLWSDLEKSGLADGRARGGGQRGLLGSLELPLAPNLAAGERPKQPAGTGGWAGVVAFELKSSRGTQSQREK